MAGPNVMTDKRLFRFHFDHLMTDSRGTEGPPTLEPSARETRQFFTKRGSPRSGLYESLFTGVHGFFSATNS